MISIITDTEDEQKHLVYLDGIYAGYIKKEFNRWDKVEYYRINPYCPDRNTHEFTRETFKNIAAARYAFERIQKEYVGDLRKSKTKSCSVKFLTAEIDPDFYPTPTKLIGLMIAGIKKLGYINTVLEPSAGKGDILDCLKNSKYKVEGYGRYSYFDRADIDCIELDENLQHILNGKGYKVVYDDFLSFHTLKRYDLIIMNPPFSNGAKHLLKAIDLQRNGGQICCLLNAETLLNPYTIERKELLKQLEMYGASVKYVEDAFKHAERKTDVTIAVIWIDIPLEKGRSHILEGLEKAEEEDFEDTQGSTELALGDYLENLVSGFKKECQLCRTLILEHDALRPYIMHDLKTDDPYNPPIIGLKIDGKEIDGTAHAINRCIRAVRRKYWEAFLTNEELMSKFTSTLREQFMSMRDDMKDFDFNIFNIKKILARMNAELFNGVESCIFSLFDELSNKHAWRDDYDNGNIHYYNGWKTNKAHYVNKKVILPCYNAFSSWNGTFDNRNAYDALADIEKSLNYLDGKATEGVDLRACIDNHPTTRKIPCKYFYVTFFKKGTMHIQFKEEFQYLVDALNIYVGRSNNWLPPSYGKKRYEDMDREEQAVIDEFQGKEEYRKVMNEPNLYLYTPSSDNVLSLMG